MNFSPTWNTSSSLVITELKNIIQGEVSDSSVDLEKYSRDASIFEVTPELIVSPIISDGVLDCVQDFDCFINASSFFYGWDNAAKIIIQ